LKENVIVGRLIPAGTGLAYHNTRRKQQTGEDQAATPELVIETTDAGLSAPDEQVA
jgi:DNA-directed RNA polymerase subunit beta'